MKDPSTTRHPILTGIAHRTATVLLSVGATLVFAEAYFRLAEPTPLRQVVRPTETVQIEEIQGVSVWYNQAETDVLRNEDCLERHPDARKIVVFGDSILHGWGNEMEERWSILAQTNLDERGGHPVCVMNYASPGFGFDELWAMAHEIVPRVQPDLILFEIFTSAPGGGRRQHTFLDGTVYAIEGLPLADDGYPSVFSLPDVLNRWLFSHSRLYEYLTLRYPSDYVDSRALPHGATEEALGDIIDLSLDHGVKLAFVLCHELKVEQRVFLDSPEQDHEIVWTLSEAHTNVEVIDLAELTSSVPVHQIRLDMCCHFNAKGQAILARALADEMLDLLPGDVAAH